MVFNTCNGFPLVEQYSSIAELVRSFPQNPCQCHDSTCMVYNNMLKDILHKECATFTLGLVKPGTGNITPHTYI